MAGAWFESVAEAQRRARRRLPRSVYRALIAGSERGTTLRDNVDAFAELGFAPRVGDRPAKRALGVTVLGQQLALPILLSPTGVQAVHPDGEAAVARAAARHGTALGLSEFASKPLAEVLAANPRTLFQTHWTGTREQVLRQLDWARQQGAVGAIITLDWSFAHGRDWGSPAIPERIGLRTAVRHGPEALTHPRWLWAYASRGRLPELAVPNVGASLGGPAPGFFAAYRDWQAAEPPSWADLAWVIRRFGGVLMLKGITRLDDARRAVDAGATAISVSNHGGNNLDGTPATIRCLPAIAAAVGDQLEVLLDGGVRRGSDVAKALALGARAVMIGRPYLWGLAAAGQDGVANVLDILRAGLDSTLLGLGRASVEELRPDDLVIPSEFGRTLGGG